MLLPPAGSSGKSAPCVPQLLSHLWSSNSGVLGLRTLYLQGEGRLDFAAWNTAIGSAAGGGGTGLQEQQMSRGDIPIIVDACISFVTQHGEWVLTDNEPVGRGWRRPACACVCYLEHNTSWPCDSLSLNSLIYKMEPSVLIFQSSVTMRWCLSSDEYRARQADPAQR